MKTTLLGFFSVLLLGACATQETTAEGACTNPKSVACSQVDSSGGTASSAAGASTGGGSAATAGSDPGTGGTDTTSGGTSSTDTSGSGGSLDTGGGGSAGVGAGGSSGSSAFGGTAGTVGGNGGAAGSTAGAGGTGGTTGIGGGSTGGTSAGGSAGTGTGACTVAVPARTSWVGTASSYSNVCTDPTYGLCNPPAYAFDTSTTTRFSTGKPQAGSEWLQIDLGAAASVNQVAVLTSNGDYGRHLQIRMSQTANDTLAPILSEKDGVTGTETFAFTATTARYILISQTGVDDADAGVTAWWSVMDVNVTCN